MIRTEEREAPERGRAPPWLAAALVAAALVVGPASGEALAGSQSLVTGAVGLDIGMSNAVYGGSRQDAVLELSVRARLLKVFGFVVAFDPASFASPSPLARAVTLTGQLFIVPTEWASVFLLGGIGSRRFVDLFDGAGRTTSYHVGAGFEVYFLDHFAVGAEYRWIIPGYMTVIDRTAGQLADSDGWAQGVVGAKDTVWTALDPANLEVVVGARYYF